MGGLHLDKLVFTDSCFMGGYFFCKERLPKNYVAREPCNNVIRVYRTLVRT